MRHEAFNAKLSAAEIKVQKMREEEIQKTKYIISLCFKADKACVM